MERLADALARERLLLEQAVFKLTQLRHVLLAGDGRFVAWAAEELELAFDALASAEVERSMIVLELAEADHLAGTDHTLAGIIAGAPAPWRTIMADHRGAMAALYDEARMLLADTRRLASAGHRVVTDVLERAHGLPATAAPGAGGGRWVMGGSNVRTQRDL
jgi:hypothetical protein